MAAEVQGGRINKVAVVYLARRAEGIAPIKRFVGSYLEHPACVGHDLVVVYKGFGQAPDLADAKAVFAPIAHMGIEIPDDGFDIGAYFEAARRLTHDHICFMNTFTEIEVDGWLASLHQNLLFPGVGMVGVMGSYESLLSSVSLLRKVIWLCNDVAIRYDEKIAYYFDFIISAHCRLWGGNKHGRFRKWVSPRWIYRQLRTLMLHPESIMKMLGENLTIEERFRLKWEGLIAPGNDLDYIPNFPAFPNPHIRSNVFMIGRESLLGCTFPSLETKMGCCAFESGSDSLTSRLRRQGKSTLVVDRNGVGYDVKDWWRSGTFRLGDQANLIASDNRSREFDQMTPGAKVTHARMTWGDYLGAAPEDFPALGHDFLINQHALQLEPWSHTGAMADDESKESKIA